MAVPWTGWWGEPTVAGLVFTALFSLWIQRRWGADVPRRLHFWTGFLALVIALLSRVDASAHYSFAVHMIQHMLLLVVAAPLLVLSIPPLALERLRQRLQLWRGRRPMWPFLAAFVLYNGTVLIRHLPVVYDAALQNPLVHAAEHMSFLAGGVVFWGLIVPPMSGETGPLGARLALVGASDVVCFLFMLALLFSHRTFYPYPLQVAPLWGLTPLEDQRLGGTAMWCWDRSRTAFPSSASPSRS